MPGIKILVNIPDTREVSGFRFELAIAGLLNCHAVKIFIVIPVDLGCSQIL